MEKYAYIRVSSKDQNPERQLMAMSEMGIKEKCIFVDYMSGKDFVRPKYIQLLKKIKRGDCKTQVFNIRGQRWILAYILACEGRW